MWSISAAHEDSTNQYYRAQPISSLSGTRESHLDKFISEYNSRTEHSTITNTSSNLGLRGINGKTGGAEARRGNSQENKVEFDAKVTSGILAKQG